MTGITSLSWLFALGFVLSCGYLADKTRRPSLLATILFSLTAVFLTATIFAPHPVLAGICMGLAMGTQGGVFHLSNLFIVKFSTPETAGRLCRSYGIHQHIGRFLKLYHGLDERPCRRGFWPVYRYAYYRKEALVSSLIYSQSKRSGRASD